MAWGLSKLRSTPDLYCILVSSQASLEDAFRLQMYIKTLPKSPMFCINRPIIIVGASYFFAKFDNLVMVTLSLYHLANLEWQNLLTKFSWNSKRTEKSEGKMVPNILEQIISDLHLLCKFIVAVHSPDVMDFNLLQYFVSTNESYWVAGWHKVRKLTNRVHR